MSVKVEKTPISTQVGGILLHVEEDTGRGVFTNFVLINCDQNPDACPYLDQHSGCHAPPINQEVTEVTLWSRQSIGFCGKLPEWQEKLEGVVIT